MHMYVAREQLTMLRGGMTSCAHPFICGPFSILKRCTGHLVWIPEPAGSLAPNQTSCTLLSSLSWQPDKHSTADGASKYTVRP